MQEGKEGGNCVPGQPSGDACACPALRASPQQQALRKVEVFWQVLLKPLIATT